MNSTLTASARVKLSTKESKRKLERERHYIALITTSTLSSVTALRSAWRRTLPTLSSERLPYKRKKTVNSAFPGQCELLSSEAEEYLPITKSAQKASNQVFLLAAARMKLKNSQDENVPPPGRDFVHRKHQKSNEQLSTQRKEAYNLWMNLAIQAGPSALRAASLKTRAWYQPALSALLVVLLFNKKKLLHLKRLIRANPT